MANKQFRHWIAIASRSIRDTDRKALCLMSNLAAKGEATPLFITRGLRAEGMIITNDHIQTVN